MNDEQYEILTKIANQFKYTCERKFGFIYLKSVYHSDIWLIEDITYRNKIQIYHMNKWGKSWKHKQAVANDFAHVFKIIQRHDKEYRNIGLGGKVIVKKTSRRKDFGNVKNTIN